MIIIKIDEKETLERGLKKLKRKFDKIGIVKELRRRKNFTKPSVKRRDEIKKGIYIESLRKEMEG